MKCVHPVQWFYFNQIFFSPQGTSYPDSTKAVDWITRVETESQQLPYYRKHIQGKLLNAGFAINSTVNTHIFKITIALLNICGFTVLLMAKPASSKLLFDSDSNCAKIIVMKKVEMFTNNLTQSTMLVSKCHPWKGKCMFDSCKWLMFLMDMVKMVCLRFYLYLTIIYIYNIIYI